MLVTKYTRIIVLILHVEAACHRARACLAVFVPANHPERVSTWPRPDRGLAVG